MNIAQLLPWMSALGLPIPSITSLLGLLPLLSKKSTDLEKSDLARIGNTFGVKIGDDFQESIVATMKANSFDSLADLLGSEAHFLPLMMKLLKKDHPDVDVVCRFCKTETKVSSLLFVNSGSVEVECSRCGEVRSLDSETVRAQLANNTGDSNVN